MTTTSKTERQRDQLAAIGAMIRTERKARRMTLDELAGSAGLSMTFLSRLERGQVACSIGNLLEIAGVLELSPAALFAGVEPATERRDFTIVRAAAGGTAGVDGPYAWRQLASGRGEQRLEAFVLELPGGRKDTPLVTHPGEEFCFVLAGEVEFRVGDEVASLAAGDSIHLRSDVPHMAWSAGGKSARLLMVTAIANQSAAVVEWWAKAAAPRRRAGKRSSRDAD